MWTESRYYQNHQSQKSKATSRTHESKHTAEVITTYKTRNTETVTTNEERNQNTTKCHRHPLSHRYLVPASTPIHIKFEKTKRNDTKREKYGKIIQASGVLTSLIEKHSIQEICPIHLNQRRMKTHGKKVTKERRCSPASHTPTPPVSQHGKQRPPGAPPQSS